MVAPQHIPRATYRLQINASFTFADAEALVPYLAELGISHLYLSPILKARPGSTHGYDIIDHDGLSEEAGGQAAFDRLTAACASHGLGILVDHVPNHMGVGPDNGWWMDVLEWGQDSPYAGYFDINWSPVRSQMRGKVLLPILGDHYGAILESGQIVPRFDRGSGTISVWYYDHRLPVAPRHYGRLLAEVEGLEDLAEFARPLAARGGKGADERRERADELKRRLAALGPAQAEAIDRVLARLAGRAGEPRSFGPLHELLEHQAYRVSYWRVAADELNYRRFFDINDLAGLRMENAELFGRAHRLMLSMLREGKIHGLRIDHIDGLFHPAAYCRELQAAAGMALGADGEQPLYLVVEKILAPFERLRRDWPVAGTTGYEFMNQVLGVFVDGEAERAMEQVYVAFTGDAMDFEDEVYRAKKLIMHESMASELTVLADRLYRIAQSHWRSRDFTLYELRRGLGEVVACFPVYRTYVTPRRLSDQDRRYIDWAVGRARKTGGGESSLWDFLHAVLTTRIVRGGGSGYSRRAVFDFAMSFQQYTGPVMAKGFEDTALYRYNRLIALNEVGGEPRRFGLSCNGFHTVNARRLKAHPHAMLATATHDSKRGEDVRVRIAALSELPDEWRQRTHRWATLNAAFKRPVGDRPAPSANDEYFLYQTLVGAWPPGGPDQGFVTRLAEAMVKSIREAKHHTSWASPDPAYEEAMVEFATRICETGRRNPFLDDFIPFQERIARVGAVYGLAQTLLKLASPGVPDIYQGCELFQLALVDPDNRRPVDYEHRRRLLDQARQRPFERMLDGWHEGLPKLFLTWKALAFRRDHPDLFREGAYLPLQVRGERRRHVCAFARVANGSAALVAVPRLVARLGPDPFRLGRAWRGVQVELPAQLAGRPWREVLGERELRPTSRRGGGASLPAEELFRDFPVALLAS